MLVAEDKNFKINQLYCPRMKIRLLEGKTIKAFLSRDCSAFLESPFLSRVEYRTQARTKGN